MGYETITAETRGSVALLTLDRPELLRECWRSSEHREAVRAFVEHR